LHGVDDPLKTTKIIAGSLVLLLAALSAHAQGDFQNLNFEGANPVAAGSPYPSYDVTAASALPGWSVDYGISPTVVVGYNAESTGAPTVSLISVANVFPPIDGNYSVLLTATLLPVSISQTALIPSATQSLFFKAVGDAPALSFALSIAGQNIPFSAVGAGLHYTLYGANISAWGNRTEQLTFSAAAVGTLNNWLIDDISFSTTTVPEPSVVALTTIGGLLFSARKWFVRR